MAKEGEAGGEERVALLHGLARTRRSMLPMARFLEQAGYAARSIGYPSRRYDIETLAERTRPELEALGRDGARLHVVTHSMGGILLRQMQRTRPIAGLGRCVMLCPPNQGSEVVDRVGHWGLFAWINGPAGRQLGTGPDGLPGRLGPVDFECGVLAGSRGWDPFLSPLFGAPNDGKVAVERTKVEGMADFKVLPAGHSFFMRRAAAQANTLAFLRAGRFLDG